MSTLRSIREKKGFTVSQLAARASIPTRMIADYEEGRQVMPLNHARLIAKALWVPIEELMPPADSVQSEQPASTPSATYQPAAPVQTTPPAGTSAPQAYTPVLTAAQRPSQEAQSYRDQRPPRPDTPRVARGGEGDARGGAGEGKGGPRGVRTPPHPPSPISEGQLQELSRLSARLEIDQEQMEARIGKSLASLTRPDAKDWIKKLRAIADEIAPSQKVRFGMWPEGQEDREAVYLREQRDAQSYITFKLFNGEEMGGIVSDFTAYTITVKQGDRGDEIVLRKLAIAYYRRSTPGAQMSDASNLEGSGSMNGKSNATNPGNTQDVGMSDNAVIVEALDEEETQEEVSSAPASTEREHDHARDDRHQPLGNDIGSDHVGEPGKPERDQMDEDRGV